MRYLYTRFLNLAHWMKMSYDGGMVTVHHSCQFSSTLTWIIVFKRFSSNSKGFPEHAVSLMSKRSSLKRENHFLAVLSPMALSQTRRKCFWSPPLLSLLYWTQREEYVVNVPISSFGTPFSLSSNDKTSICKLKHNNELQIKNGNR